MVVNKTTAVLYLIALSLSGFIHTFLRAEERGIYDDVFTADELHHYRINERGGGAPEAWQSVVHCCPPPARW
ncbi:hypothetical protein MLT45_22200 [Escherichia coli]|nr:pilus-assembly fibrillin subunit [Escherichia coli]MCN3248581.1 hypothetical protein [Escherichia coli]MCN6923977.1 hypothetical protein [Escherichia coli]MCO1114259.1 hypothetical protein [Escherichia coli]MDB8048203.1 pilus-assembly fibrillin subunit [Escherichia coli]MDB8080306.1 pilus-assembly fibrillin subunit [Escherichia coli]